MKKLLFILLTILITFPLMGQGLNSQKKYRKQLTRNHISIDTIDTKDTVYIIVYKYHENNYYNTNRIYLNRYYVNYRYSFDYSYYNWYYNNNLWSYQYNWNYNQYPNYRHKYKPRPHYNRERTIGTTRNIKSINKPNEIRPNRPIRKSNEYIRPVRTTETRYNRPANRPSSTYQKPTRMRYNQHNHRNVVNKPNNNVRQRNYNSNGNRSGSINRGSTTKSGTSNRSSSGRSRR